MSFFEPRLKPLPNTFYVEGEASPVRAKVLRRSASFAGYATYKLLDAEEGGNEAESSAEPQDVMIWPPTDDEFEIDPSEWQEKTVDEKWKTADIQVSKPKQEEQAPPQEVARSKVQVSLEAALLPSSSCRPVGLPMLPLEPCGGLTDHPLDETSFLPPERLLPIPNCVPHKSGFEMFHAHHPILSQPKYEEMRPSASHEASFKNSSRGIRRSNEKSKYPGLQDHEAPGMYADRSDNPKLPPQVDQAMKAGARAIDKARELNAQRALNERNQRSLMPAVAMKPRHAPERRETRDAPVATFGKASGRGRK